MIALGEGECEVIDDYLDRKREHVTNEHGCDPLVMTKNGRMGKVTIRRTAYRLTLPCILGDVPPR